MIENQINLFLIFICNGLIIGILFDFFRILRKSFKTSDFVTYIEDFIFWILTGILILYSIFVFNQGEIRLFMFIGITLGIIAYMVLLSSYFIKINVTIITFFKNIISKIIKTIMIPFKYIFKLIKKIFFKPISFIIINIRKNSTNLLQNFAKMAKRNKKVENNVKS